LAAILLCILVTIPEPYASTPLTVSTDPDWVPETYEEWMAGQPETVPLQVTRVAGGERDSSELVIILEEGLSDSLEPGLLDQWMGDIEMQDLSVSAVEVSYSTPEDLRDYLAGLYDEGLQGAVLVGNVTAAWCAMDNAFLDEGEMFPADYFFMDLDGTWEDLWVGYPSQGNPGTDGKYDTISGELGPEIYVGRIKLDNMTSLGDPTEMLNAYLERNHEWRTLGDPEPLYALCYVDDDWASWGSTYQNSMQFLYAGTILVNHPDSTNGTDYLEERLPGTWAWISPYVHSSPLGHFWSPGPTTMWNQILPAEPQARFYNLFACSNCRFTTPRCMGLVYALCTDTGLAAVGSSKTGSMLQFRQFYEPLGGRYSLGEALEMWWEWIASNGITPYERSWHLGMALLGDPTLVPAMHITGVSEGEPGASELTLAAMENPCSASLTISCGDTSIGGTVDLYDMTGRLVSSEQLSDGMCTMDVRDLHEGAYVAVLREDGAVRPLEVLVLDQ